MDIVEFLTARYDEFEQLAIGAAIQVDGALSAWFVWNLESPDMTIAQTTACGASEKIVWADETQARHVLAWQPRFALADLAAKRAIVSAHLYEHECADGQWYARGEGCRTVRRFAAVYAGHPDFDSAWAVDA